MSTYWVIVGLVVLAIMLAGGACFYKRRRMGYTIEVEVPGCASPVRVSGDTWVDLIVDLSDKAFCSMREAKAHIHHNFQRVSDSLEGQGAWMVVVDLHGFSVDDCIVYFAGKGLWEGVKALWQDCTLGKDELSKMKTYVGIPSAVVKLIDARLLELSEHQGMER